MGSTNSLLLQQKDRYSDILINVHLTFVGGDWLNDASLMTQPSTSRPRRFAMLLPSPRLTDAGSTSSLKPSPRPGTRTTPAGRKHWATWARKNSSVSNLKSTSSPSSPRSNTTSTWKIRTAAPYCRSKATPRSTSTPNGSTTGVKRRHSPSLPPTPIPTCLTLSNRDIPPREILASRISNAVSRCRSKPCISTSVSHPAKNC